jgi:hypothetical protein
LAGFAARQRTGARIRESEGRHIERVASLDDGAFEEFVQVRIEGLHRTKRFTWGRNTGSGGEMATREFNIIMFPQLIDPECKVDVRIAEQFLENIDRLIMKDGHGKRTWARTAGRSNNG